MGMGTFSILVDENGIAKGMKQVLTERGINVHGINAAKIREELLKHDDFRNTKTLVQEVIGAYSFPSSTVSLMPLNVAGVMLKNIRDSTRMDLLHPCAKLYLNRWTHVILF